MDTSTYQEVEPHEPEGEEIPEHRLGRRMIITALTIVLVSAACIILGLAFAQGSWWYHYGTDRALDRESRARLETIRDTIDASGTAPRAVTWLDAALAPHTDPSTARSHIKIAQEILEETGDPTLAEAAEELGAIAEMIRPSVMQPSSHGPTSTPYVAPTLEWP